MNSSYHLVDHLKICLIYTPVPAQGATVLLLHCVLYKGMLQPPASSPSRLSPLGHNTWLALQQYNLLEAPIAPILMSMVWVVALVVLNTIPSILDL